MVEPANTLGENPRESRARRLFASPAGVLIILPLLVVSVGVVVLVLGRTATRDSAETMARYQLDAQAAEVNHDVTFALEQAGPVLASLKLIAEPALATPDAVQRVRDVVIGRPGIANASIVFPTGVMWGTYVDRKNKRLMVHETRVSEHLRTNYGFDEGVAKEVNTEPTDYDPLSRPQYVQAVTAKKRVWLPPRTFSTSHRTGITVTEPVLDETGEVTAVITLDYDVGELSKFIRKPPLQGARTVLLTSDGTVLAHPSAAIPDIATREKRLLRYTDFRDPALDVLFAELQKSPPTGLRFSRLDTSDGAYLASVAPVDSSTLRAYVATFVPEHTLFAATRRFNRTSIIASAAALAIALGVALMFAWNIIRMRRAVGVARAAAKSAEERAKQAGSYRLVERLGQGGMGEVWRAEHQLLARHAAIKLVRREALLDPAHAEYVHERFRREAQTLASLRSRHTTELYDYGVTDDGSFFFVMELLTGLDLSKLVREHGPQPAARVISILTQACSSLAEAHDAGLLHRDIKPANLFLSTAADEVDIVKLLDFGIVHNVAEPVDDRALPATASLSDSASGERLTTEGVVIGTPGYIPPEQAVGAPLDARGDLYALGCVAWWLLTGDEVFPSKTGDDAVHAHVSEPIPTLRDKVSGWLPHDLEAVIVECLAKQPAARPASARVLADTLRAITIPDEHAWTTAQAVAWWHSLSPSAISPPETPTVAAGVVVAKVAPVNATTDRSAVVPGTRAPSLPDGPAVTVGKRMAPRTSDAQQTVASRKSRS